MEKVLILGASGLVGRALIDEFKNKFDLYGTYSSTLADLPNYKQFQLEVQQVEKWKDIIRSVKPDIVISCLRGDFEQQLQLHKELALNLRNTNSRLYFFSTTNVFDGDHSKPHSETDLPVSISDYGKFKIECEHMLKEILQERAIILRIPAIWGKNSQRWNLIKGSIKENKKIDVYTNLVCNNLLDVQLAKQLRYIIENNLNGLFHLGSIDTMTQGQFFEEILTKLGADKSLLQTNIFLKKSETYYFALKSNRLDIPVSLQSTNNDIIDHLLETI
jgi:dTDP-4-dehydrorhamnose reductase